MSEPSESEDNLAISVEHRQALELFIEKAHASHGYTGDRSEDCASCDGLHYRGLNLLESVANEARTSILEIAVSISDQVVSETLKMADDLRLQGQRAAIEETMAGLISDYGYAAATSNVFYRKLNRRLDDILEALEEE